MATMGDSRARGESEPACDGKDIGGRGETSALHATGDEICYAT
jgi:hypothetical protein